MDDYVTEYSFGWPMTCKRVRRRSFAWYERTEDSELRDLKRQQRQAWRRGGGNPLVNRQIARKLNWQEGFRP